MKSLILLAAIAAYGLHTFVLGVADSLAIYRAESACVMHYIATGVARNQILTFNGTCLVKD